MNTRPLLRLTVLTCTFLLYTAMSWGQSSLPLPQGDGQTDDAPAIQALLDSGSAVVYLPPPSKSYLIRKTLRIHSHQTLRLDPQTTIRLADHAMQHLISNADTEKGNVNITIEGGIWDGNNMTQTCRYHEKDKAKYTQKYGPFDPKEYLGVLMQFTNVRNLTIKNVTLKDPETFGIQMGNIVGFNIENILFDYNLKKGNMDGVHVHGDSRQGRIVNLRGNTNDDMVALNANDARAFEISSGEISDVLIDGLWADNGYTAVRLLSSGDPVRRIRIQNVFGSWRLYVVSFTHHNVHPGDRLIEDISIGNIFSAKQLEEKTSIPDDLFWINARKSSPLFYIEAGMLVRNLHIENLVRREYFPYPTPAMIVGNGAIIEGLSLSNITQINQTESELKFIENAGEIKELSLDRVQLKGRSTAPVIGNGKVSRRDQ